jgi:hypothetical protein
MRLWWGVLGLLLLALPARADTFFDISGTATLTGNDTCNGPCVETINFAFQMDEQPLPDQSGSALFVTSASAQATGPLGDVTNIGGFNDQKWVAIVFGSLPESGPWTEFDLVSNPFPPPATPFTPQFGGYLYSCPIAGGCFGFCPFTYSTEPGNCIENETLQTTVTAVNAGDPPGVATPEPQTWAMLWIGLIGLALLKFSPRGKRLKASLPLVLAAAIFLKAQPGHL